MAIEYTYTTIGDKYFSMQSSILFFAWILLFKHRTLHLDSLGIQRRQALRILKSLLKFRLFGRTQPPNSITLPVSGHLCIKVHRGFKIFNFADSSATKFFNPEVSVADAADEIRSVTGASSLDFAPTILEFDPGNRWYTETLILGKRSKKTEQSDPVAAIKNIMTNHLRKMVLSRPVQTVSLGNYIHNLQNLLTEPVTALQIDDELHSNVKAFIEMTSARLTAFKHMPVMLALTHGDFSFVNCIYRDNDILVVDWEAARERSALHDLFNYFFTEIYYERTRGSLETGINDAALLFSNHINLEEPPEFSGTTDTRTVYRWIYYLERTLMLLRRDASANRSRVIQRTIDIFSAYESK